MAKHNTPAPLADTPQGDDDRYRRGIGTQKPRTLAEEKAAWGRRLRRWKRKNDTPEANGLLAAALALDPSGLSKESTGLAFLRYKAEKAIGADATEAAFKAAMGYRNAE